MGTKRRDINKILVALENISWDVYNYSGRAFWHKQHPSLQERELRSGCCDRLIFDKNRSDPNPAEAASEIIEKLYTCMEKLNAYQETQGMDSLLKHTASKLVIKTLSDVDELSRAFYKEWKRGTSMTTPKQHSKKGDK